MDTMRFILHDRRLLLRRAWLRHCPFWRRLCLHLRGVLVRCWRSCGLWVEAMIVRPCSQAIVALTFSYYVVEPLFPDCDQPDKALILLAAVCICEYLAIHVLSFCRIVFACVRVCVWLQGVCLSIHNSGSLTPNIAN